jgi:transposase
VEGWQPRVPDHRSSRSLKAGVSGESKETEMTKATRAQYTLEFKQEAVRMVESGQSIAAAARSLGVVEQTLYNWVKAQREGRLKGPANKVSAEQMEISRLRAELARVKMERDILGKATAYFAKGPK